MRLPGPEVGSAPEPRLHMPPTSTHRACTAAPRVLQTHGNQTEESQCCPGPLAQGTTRRGSFRTGLPQRGPRHWAEGSLGSRKPQRSQTPSFPGDMGSQDMPEKASGLVTSAGHLTSLGCLFHRKTVTGAPQGEGHGNAWDQNSANVSYPRKGWRGRGGQSTLQAGWNKSLPEL